MNHVQPLDAMDRSEVPSQLPLRYASVQRPLIRRGLAVLLVLMLGARLVWKQWGTRM